MRWGVVFGAFACGALGFVACDDIERDADPRYYVPPPEDADVPADLGDAAPSADGEGGLDAGTDAIADVDAGPAAPILATGSGNHPDVAVGSGDHTCVAGELGDAGAPGVWCWGANDHGQLGLGTTGDGTFAADVAVATRIEVDETGLPFTSADELALAPWHSCARRQGLLFCWGQRYSGAQAEPPSAIGPDRTAPRAIGNLDVVRVAAGGPHTCAVKTNGRAVCFGHSALSELGRPNTTDATCTAPIFYDYQGQIAHTCSGALLEAAALTSPDGGAPPDAGADAGATKAASVAAGEVHSCALSDGRVYCWGTNLGAQLGRPGAQTGEATPQLVVVDANLLTPLDGVSMLVSSGNHSCALRQGSVLCWGTNDADQLGVPTATVAQRASAAPVAGIANVVSVGVAERVSCAVRADKTVWCWGADVALLSDGGALASSPTPTQVKGPGGAGVLTDVEAVAPGLRHVCVLRTDKTVWCWGKNDRGQLGDGSKVDNPYPVKVMGLP